MSFKVVAFKMPQEMSDRIDECVASLGVKRMAWVRAVLAAALKKEGFPVPAEMMRPKQGERTDMRDSAGRARALKQLDKARSSRAGRAKTPATVAKKPPRKPFVSPPISQGEIETADRLARRLLSADADQSDSAESAGSANSAA